LYFEFARLLTQHSVGFAPRFAVTLCCPDRPWSNTSRLFTGA
jgi:hypothetical protein